MNTKKKRLVTGLGDSHRERGRVDLDLVITDDDSARRRTSAIEFTTPRRHLRAQPHVLVCVCESERERKEEKEREREIVCV